MLLIDTGQLVRLQASQQRGCDVASPVLLLPVLLASKEKSVLLQEHHDVHEARVIQEAATGFGVLARGLSDTGAIDPMASQPHIE
jgi:hypothetical protein